ncbi:MAG: hypothetical protein M5U14_13260 [Acidimicrobiia bacterium]|nr:hypothetical protein [Acidimicrobiia bacterium]
MTWALPSAPVATTWLEAPPAKVTVEPEPGALNVTGAPSTGAPSLSSTVTTSGSPSGSPDRADWPSPSVAPTVFAAPERSLPTRLVAASTKYTLPSGPTATSVMPLAPATGHESSKVPSGFRRAIASSAVASRPTRATHTAPSAPTSRPVGKESAPVPIALPTKLSVTGSNRETLSSVNRVTQRLPSGPCTMPDGVPDRGKSS